jgi:hypothetical protein
VGRNDDLQSHGFHDRETIAEREIRWLGKAAEVLLSPVFEGRGYLRIEGIAPPEEAGEPLELRAEVSGRTLVSMVTPGQGPFVLRLPVLVEEGDQRVSLSADRTWRPVDMGLGADRRDLSVAISAVGLESESD